MFKCTWVQMRGLGKGQDVLLSCSLKSSCPTFPASKGREENQLWSMSYTGSEPSESPCLPGLLIRCKKVMSGCWAFCRGLLWKANSSSLWLPVGRGKGRQRQWWDRLIFQRTRGQPSSRWGLSIHWQSLLPPPVGASFLEHKMFAIDMTYGHLNYYCLLHLSPNMPKEAITFMPTSQITSEWNRGQPAVHQRRGHRAVRAKETTCIEVWISSSSD